MTTFPVLMRYIDVSIASGRSHGGEDGRSSQAASTSGSVAAQRQSTCGGGQDCRSATANRISLAGSLAGTRHRRPAHHGQRRSAFAHDGRACRGIAGSPAGWADGKRIWHRPMDAQAGAPTDREALRHQVQRRQCLADSGQHGLLQPEARETSHRTQRGSRGEVETTRLTCAQKKPSENAA